MKVIGITGLTGSGKTEAAYAFARKGAYMIGADKTGHKMLLKGRPAYSEVLSEFGMGILGPDGEIVRAELGKIVFSDYAKLMRLNEITHKYIIKDILEEIAQVKESHSDYKAIVVDAILLIESGLDKACDIVIIVFSDEAARMKRIIRRDGIAMDAALRRISSQNTVVDFRKIADYMLDNNGDIGAFIRKAEDLAERLIGVNNEKV